MNVKELRAAAKSANVKGYSRMSKAELEAALPASTVAPLFEAPVVNQPLLNSVNDQDVSLVYATLSKGQARKLRKQLRAEGRAREAGLPAARAA
jgi:hypothetical protein